MKNNIVFPGVCIALMVFMPLKGIAQTPLTLDQAVIRVLENHPRLKVYDYEAQAMAARMRQALQPPADKMSVTLENFAGTGEMVAVRGIETTLSLSRTLELGNKATHRGGVVTAETQLLSNQKDIDRLNLLADTAQRLLHVAADQERLKLAEAAITLVQVTEKSVQDRIQAGRTPDTERQRVVIDLANHQLELEHVRHELENSRVSLSTLWNEIEPDFDHIEADLFKINGMPEFSELTGLLDRNPQLIRQIKASDLAQAKIRLMQSRRRPDVDVSAGLRYLGGSNDIAAMVWASIPLGTHTRGQAGVDEAEAMAKAEPLNLEQTRLELYATLFEMYQEMKHANEALSILNGRIIPAAETMLKDYEEGYQTGRYSLLELVQVRQTLRNAKVQLVEMAYNFHSRKIEIDRLTGAQLTQW